MAYMRSPGNCKGLPRNKVGIGIKAKWKKEESRKNSAHAPEFQFSE